MKRSTTAAVLIVSQLIYVISLAAWLFVLGMSVMGFDGPEAASDSATWLLFAYVLVYPAAILAGGIAGWIRFAKRGYRSALIWNGLPLPWLIPLIALLVYAFVA
ncbi:hypothetical protein I8J29_20230 [Paenibacillus sp. MWE-103]|uniref:Uncharacterized protein n=1 Tax=Paenibacillus artemisiicola TaxID=1172618 RepID=A0ABS3WE54_9BACL|nr:hypothetical protein [Paenibacillus artemisiicola]MBO7746547.1 hypothetical protein [Paenibacillus artemisiicola]